MDETKDLRNEVFFFVINLCELCDFVVDFSPQGHGLDEVKTQSCVCFYRKEHSDAEVFNKLNGELKLTLEQRKSL